MLAIAVPASDHSLLISFGNEISAEAGRNVARLSRALRGPGIRNVHPGYSTVLVTFDPRLTTHEEVERRAREAWELAPEPEEGRLIEIPVVYGGDAGPDLGDVARYTGLTPERVVELHASVEYPVHFLGFTAGFPYLTGMPAAIATPRLDRPRASVPAGSVAIGGHHTGVYPVASPGGWRIIGRTSRRLLRLEDPHPTLLEMGDRVRFIPVEGSRLQLAADDPR